MAAASFKFATEDQSDVSAMFSACRRYRIKPARQRWSSAVNTDTDVLASASMSSTPNAGVKCCPRRTHEGANRRGCLLQLRRLALRPAITGVRLHQPPTGHHRRRADSSPRSVCGRREDSGRRASAMVGELHGRSALRVRPLFQLSRGIRFSAAGDLRRLCGRQEVAGAEASSLQRRFPGKLGGVAAPGGPDRVR